jgi:hypothetical protein
MNKLFLSVLCASGLLACTPVATPKPDAHFGEAVTHNIAVQTVNPHAPNDKGPIAFNGARQAKAQTRYENDKVKEPADPSTSKILMLGGNGAGGE